MKILLLGPSGYIGSAILREARKRGLDCVPLSRSECDYTTPRELDVILSREKPYAVINAAAFIPPQSVYYCEDHRRETLRYNLVFPAMLANQCADAHIVLMHLSTGCLYQGDNDGQGWTEDDPPILNFDCKNGMLPGVYVGSKQLAEELVRKYPLHYIVRLRLPFDAQDGQRNYLSKLIRYPKVLDGCNSIVHRDDLAKACLSLLSAPWGTYHVVNEGGIFAHDIVTMMKRTIYPAKSFEYWHSQAFAREYPLTTKSTCVLSVKKLASRGIAMRPVKEAVQEALDQWEWEEQHV